MDLVMCLAELDDSLWHIRELDHTDAHRGSQTKTSACGREVIGDICDYLILDAPQTCPLCVKAIRTFQLI